MTVLMTIFANGSIHATVTIAPPFPILFVPPSLTLPHVYVITTSRHLNPMGWSIDAVFLVRYNFLLDSGYFEGTIFQQ